MVTSSLFRFAAVAMVSGMVACGSTSSSTEDAQTDDALQAGAYTYFTIAPDARKCAAPACGGWFVSRANTAATTCADGSSAASCYVASIDMSAINVADATAQKALHTAGNGAPRVVLRGRIVKKSFGGSVKLGVFDATEAWVAPAAASSSTLTSPFYKITDNGIRCVKAPCNSFVAKKLDTSTHNAFATLDFSSAPAAQSTQTRAQSQAESTTGILASGSLKSGTFTVDQFYLELADGKVAGDTCAADTDCAGNLVCCYPCGVQGCHDVCMAASSSGSCPLAP